MKEPRLAVKSRYDFVKNMTSEKSGRFESFKYLPQGPIVKSILDGTIDPSNL